MKIGRSAPTRLLSLVLAAALCGCGNANTPQPAPGSDGEADGPAAPQRIAVCLGDEPENLDPARNYTVDGGTLLLHLFSGLARWDLGRDGRAVVVADAAETLPEGETLSDGTIQYTYTLRDGFRWTDGRELTAGDFAFAWERAALPGSYYSALFQDIAGYDELTAAAALPDLPAPEQAEEAAEPAETEEAQEEAETPEEPEETAEEPEQAETEPAETAEEPEEAAEPEQVETEPAETEETPEEATEETAAPSDGAAASDGEAETEEPVSLLQVRATDDKTLTVTLTRPAPYWNELLATPAFLPVRKDIVSSDGWAADAETFVGNGSYTLSEWIHGERMTLEKNPDYPDADGVTMDRIDCYLSGDGYEMAENFESGEWLFVDHMPIRDLESLRSSHPDEFVTAGQMGTYYLAWNANRELLREGSPLTGPDAETARVEIRRALSLLLERSYITADIARGGQVPASSLVPLGMTEPDGTQFCENAGPSEDFAGYFNVSAEAADDNYSAAMETLKKYYTFDEESQTFPDFPTVSYLFNGGEGHRAVAEYVSREWESAGVRTELKDQELSDFLYSRRTGGYSVVRGGLAADYNDPLFFLEQWTSAGNDAHLGKGSHGDLAIYRLDLTPYDYDVVVEAGTWAETYDVLIDAIRGCRDEEARYGMMHDAEDLLMSTGCVVPLYFYTDVYLLNSRVDGFYSTPQGWKFFRTCAVNDAESVTSDGVPDSGGEG